MKLLKRLNTKKLINPPKFLLSNTAYLTMMGSVAYGVSNVGSDVDVYGFCIPPKTTVFPHLAGHIEGFGKKPKKFLQWQQHHVIDKDAKKEYDFSVYSIIRYFQLCMENNPNMIDSLFVPRTCVIHSTQLSELVRENRKLFLHKGSYYKFKGYAYSQLHKMRIKNPKEGSKRYEDVQKHGYSTKFAYHIVRLCLQCEQILVEHDLDLQRNREQLKSIRRGEWGVDRIEKFFGDKERQLEELYTKSTLRNVPDEDRIKELLLQCLEIHYGSLEKVVVREDKLTEDMRKIADIASKY